MNCLHQQKPARPVFSGLLYTVAVTVALTELSKPAEAVTAIEYATAASAAPWQATLIPSSAVACYFVGRGYLNPVNGQGEVVGYFTDINGVGASDALFNGPPSENTAFFTFRTDVFSLAPLPSNGAFTLDLVSAGEFNIYFNSTPIGDWSNPDTFSGGKPFPGQAIAKFQRPESLFLGTASIAKHILTETLVSGGAFTFNGHRYDFSAIAPGGLTINETISSTPDVPGVKDFPVGMAFAGNCVAVASASQDE